MTAVSAPSTDIPFVFHGGRVALRPVGAQDLPAFYQWRTELEALQLIRVPEGASSYEEVAPGLQAMFNRTITMLAVDPQSQETFGFVQAYGVNAVDRWCYVLTYFTSDHRAQRVALEASAGFWDFLFRYLNLRKIYFDVAELNSGWLHALPQEPGFLFKEEGQFRGHTLKDGRSWDVTRFAIYRDPWEDLREFLLLLFGLGAGQDEASTGEPAGHGARAAREGVASTARGTADGASSGRSWLGRKRADSRLSPRLDVVRRYIEYERDWRVDDHEALKIDGMVFTSPMSGTVTDPQAFAALAAFRKRMRDAAERAGKTEHVITWSPPEEDADAVRIRGRKDPNEEIELVWQFDAEDKITAFSTFGSPGLLARWVLGDEPQL